MDRYNTFVASNFVQPLTLLVSMLTRRDREGTQWKENEVETDWAISAILLAVVMFECWLRHIEAAQPQPGGQSGLWLYEELRRANSDLPDVREAFVIRDLIAHGHVWSVAIADDPGEMDAVKLQGREDKKWKELVDEDARWTRTHELPVVVTMIGRRHVKVILELLISAMHALAGTGVVSGGILRSHPIVWPDELTIGGHGRRIEFKDLPSLIT